MFGYQDGSAGPSFIPEFDPGARADQNAGKVSWYYSIVQIVYVFTLTRAPRLIVEWPEKSKYMDLHEGQTRMWPVALKQRAGVHELRLIGKYRICLPEIWQIWLSLQYRIERLRRFKLS